MSPEQNVIEWAYRYRNACMAHERASLAARLILPDDEGDDHTRYFAAARTAEALSVQRREAKIALLAQASALPVTSERPGT